MLLFAHLDSFLRCSLLSCFLSLSIRPLIAVYISICLAEATNEVPLVAIVALTINSSDSLNKMRVD